MVSALEGPPSGLDLPAQPFAIEEDFGEQYMDVEVPLKVNSITVLENDTDHFQCSAGQTRARQTQL